MQDIVQIYTDRKKSNDTSAKGVPGEEDQSTRGPNGGLFILSGTNRKVYLSSDERTKNGLNLIKKNH